MAQYGLKIIEMNTNQSKTFPKVYVIILNWNGVNDTLECLDSVCKLDYPNFRVVVVDNNSSDTSVESIRQQFNNVTLIQNSKNLGFTGGNNIGMEYALNAEADYIWLLNNDTIVEPDSLSKLVDMVEENLEIGLISPAVHFYHDPSMTQFIGCYIDFDNYTFIPVQDPNELISAERQSNLILYGTALLIKKDVIKSIGYLSEKFFAYVEDCDYSLRALRANFKTAVRVDSRIYHKGAQTSGMFSPTHVFLGTRNLYFFWRDNTQGVKKFFVPAYYVGMVINYAKRLLDEGNQNGLEACLNGFWAAIKGIGGGYDTNISAPPWIKSLFRFFVSWHPYFWSMLIRMNFRGIARAAITKVKT